MPFIYTGSIYTLVFWCLILLWSLSELLGPAQWHGSQTENHDQHSRTIIALTTGSGLVLSLLCPILFPWMTLQPPFLFFFLGIGFIVVGTIWRWYAIQTLSGYFTGQVKIHPDQQVVQHGPYKLVRHPSYTGILLVVAGFGLMIANALSFFALTAGMLAGLLYRIRIEEQLLQEGLPGYSTYIKRVKYRLFPFIW